MRLRGIPHLGLWLRVTIPLAVALPIVLACVQRPVDKPEPLESQQTPGYFPQSIEKDVDLLFVVDNSGRWARNRSTSRRTSPSSSRRSAPTSWGLTARANLRRGNRSGCSIPNVHIGVVSSDLGAGNYDTLPPARWSAETRASC